MISITHPPCSTKGYPLRINESNETTHFSQELTNTILAFSSDLYTFLLGYSVGDDNIADRGQGNTESNDREHPLRPIPAETKKRGIDLLEDLIDETINSNRRSDMLESQTPIVDGPIGPTLWREEEPTTHRYAEDGFACSKFQKDIRDFSESFIVCADLIRPETWTFPPVIR